MLNDLSEVCVLSLNGIFIAVPQAEVLTVAQTSSVQLSDENESGYGELIFEHQAMRVFGLSSDLSPEHLTSKNRSSVGEFCVALRGHKEGQGYNDGFALTCHKIDSINLTERNILPQSAPTFMFSSEPPITGFFHMDDQIIYLTQPRVLSNYIDCRIERVANEQAS